MPSDALLLYVLYVEQLQRVRAAPGEQSTSWVEGLRHPLKMRILAKTRMTSSVPMARGISEQDVLMSSALATAGRLPGA